MTVVALAAGDADAAVALWTAAGLVRPWNDPAADFARAIAGPSSAVLGIRDGDVLAATAMTGTDGHRGWVYYLAVAAARRGEGLGRTMMHAAERFCAERGVARMNVMVRAANGAVVGFYDRLGYRPSDVVVLQRDLTGA